MDIKLYEHNKEAYEKVQKHLENSNKTCVIHPTGTGKSFISLKFLFDNKDKKCLFMAPTDAIVEQIKTHIKDLGLTLDDFPNLEFCLYASGEKVKNNKYDYIVFDEFHRIGADVWGSNVKSLIDNNKNAKILGVSATPIRYLDDNRDMSKEIFNGDVASHLTLAEAIVKKILPVPNYISSVISFQSDIDKIQKQINNYKNIEEAKKYQKLLDKAKKMLENSEGLDDIFNKNIQNKNGKFIIFCRNLEHMKEMEEKCKDWLKKVNPHIEISEVYSKQGKKINQYNIDYFEKNEKDTLKLLFSIEMLNEGLHVKDIDGVVMFRPTESPIIYLQQLGRALSVGHNDNPLIFDIVNNFNSIDSIIDLKDEVQDLIETIKKERQNGDENSDYPKNDELIEILNKFKIFEENKEIIDILQKLDTDTIYTWEDWYALAKEYYEKNGDLEVPKNFKTINGYKYDENGYSLGGWIGNLRTSYKEKKLSDDRIKLLQDIGMIWNARADSWNKMYELAKRYYEHYGNLKIENDFKTLNGIDENENGVLLGRWIGKLRQIYKGNIALILSSKQIQMLNEIGMIWNVYDENWNKMYELAKRYYEHYGNLKIRNDFKTLNGIDEDSKGYKLGYWIVVQRSSYNGKGYFKISDEQIDLLNKIEMIWDVDEYNWMKMYNLAKEYYIKYSNLKIEGDFKTLNGSDYDENGVPLGKWIKTQRVKNSDNSNVSRISENHKELLNKIGMVWDVRADYWNKMYELAKIYYNHFNNLKIKKRFNTTNGYEEDEKGLALGAWINSIRSSYNGSGGMKLSYNQIKLLEDIHMVWFNDKADDKFQKEDIVENNKLKKQKEILNRFYSLLSKYEENELPSKEEMNKKFIKQLNREE